MKPRLFFLLLGSTPHGRHIEQHDVYFGIGNSMSDLLPAIYDFWPGTAKIHIDSWREITAVDGYQVSIVPKTDKLPDAKKIFFLNLGGYKPDDPEEYHYKLMVVANNKGEAIRKAKQTAFYQHTGFSGAASHIDDKYGVDVDDIYEIEDILDKHSASEYSIALHSMPGLPEDRWEVGYLKLAGRESL